MSYASLMVELDLGEAAGARVRLAADLAERHRSRLIGVAARQVYQVAVESVELTALAVEALAERAREDLTEAEALFRQAAGARHQLSFRSAVARGSDFLAEQARAADLIVLGRAGADDAGDWRFSSNPGDVLMQCGRPILVVPPGISELSGKHPIVAWRNSREARRAVWDALPFNQPSGDLGSRPARAASEAGSCNGASPAAA
jgi:nucleotide-binding universal stress UspA family protein